MTSSTTHGAFLRRYVGPQRLRVAILAALVVCGIGLELLAPQLIRRFLDTALSAQAAPLAQLALLYIAVACTQQLLAVATTYQAEQIAWRATNALRSALIRHCLGLDMRFHTAHTPGELIARIDGDVLELANFFSLFAVRIASNLLLLLGVLVVLFWEDWRIGLAFGASALITLGALFALRNIAQSRWEDAREASADLFGFLEERLAGREDIRANGGEAAVMRRLYELLRQLLHAERGATTMTSSVVAARLLMEGVGLIGALTVGAWLFQEGLISIGTLYLFVAYHRLVYGPLEMVMVEIEDLQEAGASVNRIQELFNHPPPANDEGATTLNAGPLAVRFEHVSFSYAEEELDDDQQRPPALCDVSFALAPGQVLGVLGRTGSGKSTLARLLVRLYDAHAGVVRVGGVDLRNVARAHVRTRVGLMSQNVQLFEGTVRENLTFFDPSIADMRLLATIEHRGLMPWYRALAAGLDTPLTSGGGGLSAGEAQILAFIRMALRDPGLLILDEASSRIDPATERLLDTALSALLVERTAIIIAHRLTTVQRADMALVLNDNGTIAEYGPRVALANDPQGRFAQLLRTELFEIRD
jgi:ABC-type multidrug transport system fused ATPase/permease subunit